jgi:hypothetical protein
MHLASIVRHEGQAAHPITNNQDTDEFIGGHQRHGKPKTTMSKPAGIEPPQQLTPACLRSINVHGRRPPPVSAAHLSQYDLIAGLEFTGIRGGAGAPLQTTRALLVQPD